MAEALIFLGVSFTVVGLVHYYLWRRLVRNTTRTRRSRRIGTWVMVGLSALVVATFVGSRVFPQSMAVLLSWPGYLWLAIMFYLLLVLAVLEIPALVARIVLRRRAEATVAAPVPVLVGALSAETDAAAPRPLPGTTDSSPPSVGTAGDPDNRPGEESRRVFLSRAVAITAGVVSVGVVGSGIGTAMGPPRLKRIEIPLAKLPRTADGLRIALVSDLHLGPLRGISHTRRVVDMVNGLDADVVAMVGDLVDGSVAELGAAAAPLRELRSRLGSFFVTGNHEYYSGYEDWIVEVERLSMRPLRNERVQLPDGLDIAGVNDPTGGSFGDGPDFDRAMADRDPARAVVLLAHQPVQAHDAARHGVDLQLSGHTHGGQMWPFHYIVKVAQQPVVSGLGQVDGMPVYVTNGAGFWGPPVRVGAPPDITLVQLRSA